MVVCQLRQVLLDIFYEVQQVAFSRRPTSNRTEGYDSCSAATSHSLRAQDGEINESLMNNSAGISQTH
jgi:hypothetical protein